MAAPDPLRALIERRRVRADELAAQARRALDEGRNFDAGILRGHACATRDFASELENTLDVIARGWDL